MLSPVVLFVYNRPKHTSQILNSLALNAESIDTILYIYCDGPKNEASEEMLLKIAETRKTAKNENRFKSVIIIEQLNNKGLASSVIDGVTEIINKHETVIVLEDDLILSPYFLSFMNDSLNRYKNHDNVGQIGACNFFACGNQYPSSFFTPIPDSWGWATWKKKWDYFNPNPEILMQEIVDKDLVHKFNVYGSYPMMDMLQSQIEGKVSSWAIRWQAVCVLNNWYTLYPNPSLTNHIESLDATHANFNILPPLMKIEEVFTTKIVEEIPNVINAMKKGFNNTGDFYGNDIVLKKGSYIRFKLIIIKAKAFLLRYTVIQNLKNNYKSL